MSVAVDCTCGEHYELKDRLAGRRVGCPACTTTIEVPARGVEHDGIGHSLMEVAGSLNIRAVVADDGRGYVVSSVEGQALGVAVCEVRSRHLWAANILFGAIVVSGYVAAGTWLGGGHYPAEEDDGVTLIFYLVMASVLFVATRARDWVLPRTRFTLRCPEGDESNTLRIRLDGGWLPIRRRYSVLDHRDQVLGILRSGLLTWPAPRRWSVFCPRAVLRAMVSSDSVLLTILRMIPTLVLIRPGYVALSPGSRETLAAVQPDGRARNGHVLTAMPFESVGVDRRVLVGLALMISEEARYDPTAPWYLGLPVPLLAGRVRGHFSDLARNHAPPRVTSWMLADHAADPDPEELPSVPRESPGLDCPVTLCLAGLITIVSLAELGDGAMASSQALSSNWVLARDAVLHGETYRLVTVVFVHGGYGHLLGNLIGLVIFGRACERVFGHRLMALLFFATAACASIASIVVNAGPGVGASGAIFGLVGALASHFWLTPSSVSSGQRRVGDMLVIWVVYQVADGMLTPYVDNAAHLGGFFSGLVLGWILAPAAAKAPAGL